MPTYYVADGEAHTRRRCRRLHRTGDRITRTDDTGGLDACPRCGDDATDDEPASVADMVDAGRCPWCPPDDRYEGDHVGQHASSAHPERWAEYSGD